MLKTPVFPSDSIQLDLGLDYRAHGHLKPYSDKYYRIEILVPNQGWFGVWSSKSYLNLDEHEWFERLWHDSEFQDISEELPPMMNEIGHRSWFTPNGWQALGIRLMGVLEKYAPSKSCWRIVTADDLSIVDQDFFQVSGRVRA